MNNQGKPKIPNVAWVLNQKILDPMNLIAPANMEVDFDYIKIGGVFLRNLFVSGYPRFVAPGWLEPIINFEHSMDISFFIYPIEGKSVLDDLRRKIAEMAGRPSACPLLALRAVQLPKKPDPIAHAHPARRR